MLRRRLDLGPGGLLRSGRPQVQAAVLLIVLGGVLRPARGGARTEVSAPISIHDESPRRTAPNQTLARSPTRTSPASTAVGARNTLAPIVGAMPLSSSSSAMVARRLLVSSAPVLRFSQGIL